MDDRKVLSMGTMRSRLRPAKRFARRVRHPSHIMADVKAERRVREWSALNDDTVTIDTRHGRMTVRTGPEESIGRSLYISGQYELDWADAATAYLRQTERLDAAGRGVLLDIGANNGVTTLGMLTRGKFTRAVALEPEPKNFGLLCRNIEQNGQANQTRTLQVAASDQEAPLEFELSADNFGDHRIRAKAPGAVAPRFGEDARRVIEVPGLPLDKVVAELPEVFTPIALAWIDVQGFEAAVIRGGADLWATRIPVVSEVWPYGLARAGTTRDELAALAARHWSRFAVRGADGFTERPIGEFGAFFDDLDVRGKFANVIYLP